MTITAAFGKLFSARPSNPEGAARSDARIAFKLTADAPFRASAHR